MGKSGDERSPGGSAILRHEAPGPRPFQPAVGSKTAEYVERHIEQYFGVPQTVFHEIVSDRIHLDIHVIAPTAERPEWTLVTSGMSDLYMTVPPGAEEFRLAELVLRLPGSWELGRLQVTPPPPELASIYWPLGWLKKLARFPHEFETWLGPGHTLPNGDPPRPFAPDTQLCCWWMLPVSWVPEEGAIAWLPNGNGIHFYSVLGLTREETAFKLARGTDALIELFDAQDVGDVLDPKRASLVPRRKKWFGLF